MATPGPAPQPCGTDAAYRRHLRRHQIPCRPCTDAHALAEEDWRHAPQRRATLDAEVAIYDRQHRGERAS